MAKYTVAQLLESTGKLAKWREAFYANSAGILGYQIIPFKGMKSLVFEWRHKPSKPGADYIVFIAFDNVKYSDHLEKTDGTWMELEYKGDTYYYEKPRIDVNPVRVGCSCPDYEFRFSYPNFMQKLHYGGTYNHYTRKTPPPEQGGRPHVNPENHPGMCKHIFNSLKRMETEHMMQ